MQQIVQQHTAPSTQVSDNSPVTNSSTTHSAIYTGLNRHITKSSTTHRAIYTSLNRHATNSSTTHSTIYTGLNSPVTNSSTTHSPIYTGLNRHVTKSSSTPYALHIPVPVCWSQIVHTFIHYSSLFRTEQNWNDLHAAYLDYLLFCFPLHWSWAFYKEY